MNPESRIKLIRSLEEIREYESNTYKSNFSRIFGWVSGVIFISIIGFTSSSSIVKENPVLILFWVLPLVVQLLWTTFHKKLNNNYKLLASAVLELGSIVQESAATEVTDKIHVAAAAQKKQEKKRKKK